MKDMFEKNLRGNWSVPILIRRAIVSWLTGAAMEYLLLGVSVGDLQGLTGISRMSAGRMVAVAGAVFILLTLAQRFLPENAERWGLWTAAAVLCAGAMVSSFTVPFAAAGFLVLAVLTVYALWGWQRESVQPTVTTAHWGFPLAVAMATMLFFLVVCGWTVGRVRSFSTPTYDFGIFSQMFHSMKTTGLPVTTLERDGALSHFAVHMSPIYYLMLPFYWLVSKPESLQVMQAAVLASGVLPLWKLGKCHGLSPLARTLVCFLMLLYPAYAGGTSYDLHENCFLTPLILWLFYGIDRKNGIMTAVFALLTLMVKEDAAVYVAVVGLYLLLRSLLHQEKWGVIAGGIILAGATCWFVAVTGYLATSGDGVMTYRYQNFMFNGSDSLATVIKAVLLCPMKAVFECVDAEKLEFIGLTLLPLAGLPLVTRRYERFVLLIPYILVNLMSDYQYQHSIFFQYTYGSTACLFYLTVVNLADWKENRTRLAALALTTAVAAGCFGSLILPKASYYSSICVTYRAYYDGLREVLDAVPDGASVASTTFYTTYLSQRAELYDIRYAQMDHVFGCDYLVVGVKDENCLKKYKTDTQSGYESFVEILADLGYEMVAEKPDCLEIYRKTP